VNKLRSDCVNRP